MQRRYLWLLTVAIALVFDGRTPAPAAVPEPFKNQDIGAPDPPGSTEVKGTGAEAVWTITGTGSDIWNSADQFQFTYTDLPADGGITARLLTQTGGHSDGWARTGTMLRENLEPGSRCAYMPYTNGNAFQPGWRVETDTIPTDNGLGSEGRTLEAGPIWIRTQRKGQVYQHLLSDDGKSWQLIGSKVVPIEAGKPVLAGLCATMHGGEEPVVATFDNVSVSADVIVPPPAPTRLQAFPGAGAVLLTYGSTPDAVGYTIYRRAPGDAVEKAAKVNQQPTPHTWFIDDGAGAGLANDKPLIYSVKAVLESDTGETSESIASQEVLVTPQLPLLGGFYRYDLDTLNPGSATIEGDALTIKAAGEEIGGLRDGGTYLLAPMAGEYSVSAQLLEFPKEEPATDGYAKVGPIIRTGLGPGDPYAYLFASAARDPNLHFEARRTFLGGSIGDVGGNVEQPGLSMDEVTFPLWLKLTRAGESVSAFYSNDGTTYTQLGEPVNFGRMPAVTYAGLAATAHNDKGSVIGKLDAKYGIRIE
jgi:hypothetical protein